MSTYWVSGQVTISVSTRVEAKSKKEAKKLAADRGLVNLCRQCADGDPDDEWVTSGELDGIPSILEINEGY